jgi:Ca2+-binding RTX toxin-like protein
MIGSFGNDKMEGGEGNDIMNGDSGFDVMDGGAGNDQMYGSFEDDNMDGGPGNDSIVGDYHADTIKGGDGDDKIYAFQQFPPYLDYADGNKDKIDCGPGIDEVWLNTSTDLDEFTNCETVHKG